METDRPEFREHMYGPELYSWWIHRDRTDVDRPLGDRVTIMEIQGWNRYSGAGEVEVHYYSLNGTSNNRDFGDPKIPEKLRHVSIDSFWEMVESGEIQHMEEQAHVMREAQPLLNIGDRIGPTGDL